MVPVIQASIAAETGSPTILLLDQYKQVWAFTTDEMNAAGQDKIVDYISRGGHVILYPNMPVREMNGTACTIIREAVQVTPVGTDAFDSALIDILGLKDIKCANPQVIFDEGDLKDASVIAQNIRGKICGFQKAVGKGQFTHLGTWIGFDTEGHKEVYRALLATTETKPREADADHPDIIVRERFTDKSAVLFVGNYYNEAHTTQVYYTHPVSGKEIHLPLEQGMEMPGIYAILSPIAMPLTENLSLLHTSSDVLHVKTTENTISFRLFGHRDLIGELALEGSDHNRIVAATINGHKLAVKQANAWTIIQYKHLHNKKFELQITLS